MGLSVANILTNAFLIRFFRNKFKMLNSKKGIIVTSLVGNFIPVTATHIILQNHFTNHLLTLNSTNLNECLLCNETKSSIIHLIVGTVLPAVGCWLGTYSFAYHTPSIPVPPINNETFKKREMFMNYLKNAKNVLKLTTKNFSPLLMKLLIVQFIACNLVFYMQQNEFFRLEKQLNKFSSYEIESIDDEEFVLKKNNFQDFFSKINPFKSS